MGVNLAALENIIMFFVFLCIVAVAACVAGILKTNEGQEFLNQILPCAILKFKIEKESLRIKKLLELNSQYNFSNVPPQAFTKECSSKAEFDRVSLEDFFALVIKQNYQRFQTYDQQIENNIAMYKEYLQEFEKIEAEIYHSTENSKYKSAELSLIEDKKKRISHTYTITVTKRYVSPAGRNRYVAEKVYKKEDIEAFLIRAKRIDLEREKRRSHIEHERSLMTSSLRYDIIKRDCGRCVLCGASAKDGVKLQVDHIIPVSKGGKTVPNNLRTLCDRCNMGKKDKYDPHGFN